MKIQVQIKKLREGVSLPVYMTSEAAGMDLFAAIQEEITLMPGEINLIPTGIAIALPSGFEAQIRPRSGLAVKYGITLINAPGTIDADYRGEIKVALINLGKEEYIIKPGDRIAQMVVAPVTRVEWQVVFELPSSERARGGFGHTGC
ncbi:MAG: dUTP diphosphatase [Candidatus Desulfofervidaceae bacterium]|nr:dUTP diphosphatase [Candidatus Desulfofervidaceae bacterium]